VSNRASRRAEISRFRQTAGGEMLSYLFDASMPLDGHLEDAVQYWQSRRSVRRAVCVGCGDSPVTMLKSERTYWRPRRVRPGNASVSAFCGACWADMSDAEVEAVALRVHRLFGLGRSAPPGF
jgi:hypothetical protein